MKLPEYDNRPGMNEPLYHDADSGWNDIKFVLMLIGLPLLALFFFGSAIADLFRLFFG